MGTPGPNRSKNGNKRKGKRKKIGEWVEGKVLDEFKKPVKGIDVFIGEWREYWEKEGLEALKIKNTETIDHWILNNADLSYKTTPMLISLEKLVEKRGWFRRGEGGWEGVAPRKIVTSPDKQGEENRRFYYIGRTGERGAFKLRVGRLFSIAYDLNPDGICGFYGVPSRGYCWVKPKKIIPSKVRAGDKVLLFCERACKLILNNPFCGAHELGRRNQRYYLFGLDCSTLSVTSRFFWPYLDFNSWGEWGKNILLWPLRRGKWKFLCFSVDDTSLHYFALGQGGIPIGEDMNILKKESPIAGVPKEIRFSFYESRPFVLSERQTYIKNLKGFVPGNRVFLNIVAAKGKRGGTGANESTPEYCLAIYKEISNGWKSFFPVYWDLGIVESGVSDEFLLSGLGEGEYKAVLYSIKKILSDSPVEDIEDSCLFAVGGKGGSSPRLTLVGGRKFLQCDKGCGQIRILPFLAGENPGAFRYYVKKVGRSDEKKGVWLYRGWGSGDGENWLSFPQGIYDIFIKGKDFYGEEKNVIVEKYTKKRVPIFCKGLGCVILEIDWGKEKWKKIVSEIYDEKGKSLDSHPGLMFRLKNPEKVQGGAGRAGKTSVGPQTSGLTRYLEDKGQPKHILFYHLPLGDWVAQVILEYSFPERKHVIFSKEIVIQRGKPTILKL